jgi:hypothetical protein
MDGSGSWAGARSRIVADGDADGGSEAADQRGWEDAEAFGAGSGQQGAFGADGGNVVTASAGYAYEGGRWTRAKSTLMM